MCIDNNRELDTIITYLSISYLIINVDQIKPVSLLSFNLDIGELYFPDIFYFTSKYIIEMQQAQTVISDLSLFIG